jgi:DNA-binding NarL/FixJ family response regulator
LNGLSFGVNLENTVRVEPKGRTRYRVLIADDAPAVRQALAWVLADVPELEIVGEAADGIETLACARETKPHLVILDIQMPQLDGYAVARKLKQDESPPRILFLTGHSDSQGPEKARLAGGDGYIEKSKGWLALIEQIRQVLKDMPGDSDPE